jgi:hypothetical protein
MKTRIGKEGDKDFKFRMMKQIFETDLKKHNDRFSMPSNQIIKLRIGRILRQWISGKHEKKLYL